GQGGACGCSGGPQGGSMLWWSALLALTWRTRRRKDKALT
ncbi:MAG: GlyGly-CTERM sorting domain-containing protein, partial [Oligoflexia bacterium]|nr:GlyGly-CTERM sorting domain-containing protein [Oligoflexia bacterium]